MWTACRVSFVSAYPSGGQSSRARSVEAIPINCPPRPRPRVLERSRSAAARPGRPLRDALEHDDRDNALRPLRVVAESGEIVAVSLVQAIALRPLRDGRRADLELVGPDLDLRLPVLHQVVVPAGMLRRAAHRGSDHITIPITVVHERRRPDLSA